LTSLVALLVAGAQCVLRKRLTRRCCVDVVQAQVVVEK
jgi:hypothetical protein